MLEPSDEDYLLIMLQMIDQLAVYGIDTERKSVYNDMDILRQMGIDIILVRGNQ